MLVHIAMEASGVCRGRTIVTAQWGPGRFPFANGRHQQAGSPVNYRSLAEDVAAHVPALLKGAKSAPLGLTGTSTGRIRGISALVKTIKARRDPGSSEAKFPLGSSSGLVCSLVVICGFTRASISRQDSRPLWLAFSFCLRWLAGLGEPR